MANNLFISYDLIGPNRDYDRIIAEIKKLGAWAKIHKSLWYVNSIQSSSSVASKLKAVMDGNDTLIVIDASNNQAHWYNLIATVPEHILDNWNR